MLIEFQFIILILVNYNNPSSDPQNFFFIYMFSKQNVYLIY